MNPIIKFFEAQKPLSQKKKDELALKLVENNKRIVKDLLDEFTIYYQGVVEAHQINVSVAAQLEKIRQGASSLANQKLSDHTNLSKEASSPWLDETVILSIIKLFLHPNYEPPYENPTGIQAHLFALWVCYLTIPYCSKIHVQTVWLIDSTAIKLIKAACLYIGEFRAKGKKLDQGYLGNKARKTKAEERFEVIREIDRARSQSDTWKGLKIASKVPFVRKDLEGQGLKPMPKDETIRRDLYKLQKEGLKS